MVSYGVTDEFFPRCIGMVGSRVVTEDIRGSGGKMLFWISLSLSLSRSVLEVRERKGQSERAETLSRSRRQ